MLEELKRLGTELGCIRDNELIVDDIAVALAARKAELEAALARLSAPPEEQTGISFGKRVGEGTSIAIERMVQVDAHDKLLATSADVNRALVKLEEETYGLCDNCGVKIPAARLEALPWATRCIACAATR